LAAQITALPPGAVGGGAKRRGSFLNMRVGDKRGSKDKKEKAALASAAAAAATKKEPVKKESVKKIKKDKKGKKGKEPVNDYESQPWYVTWIRGAQ